MASLWLISVGKSLSAQYSPKAKYLFYLLKESIVPVDVIKNHLERLSENRPQ